MDIPEQTSPPETEFAETSGGVFTGNKKISGKNLNRRLFFIVLFICLLVIAPQYVPPSTRLIVTIKSGDNLGDITSTLADARVIHFATEFRVLARLLGVASSLKAGQYHFSGLNTVFSVLSRLQNADYRIPTISITFREGLSNTEMLAPIRRTLPNFPVESFIRQAISLEGYLFPDTYTFYETVTPEEIIARMHDRFTEKVNPLLSDILKSGKTLKQITIMASLLEKEASDNTDRKIISGILWKRLSLGIALQVDAVFPYILNKNTFELSLDDLKIDSPYNTYKYKGLPLGPIDNPGLDAIKAAIYPTPSAYLYYLSDKEGITHYAKTFDEHKRNKALYLR